MTDADRLKRFAERIEKIREEKKAATVAERDIFTEIKAAGIDTKAFRKVLQRRAMNPRELADLDALIETYEAALEGKGVAAEALRAGASIRQAAKAGGISVGSAAALARVQKTREIEHDPDTGEILESGAPEAAAPVQGGGLADEDSGVPALVINSTSHGSIEGRTIESGDVLSLPPSTAPAVVPEPPAVWACRESARPDAIRTSDPGTGTAGGLSPTAAAIGADFEAMARAHRRVRIA